MLICSLPLHCVFSPSLSRARALLHAPFRDALLTSFINSATSFCAGFVIFSVLGYMAHASGQSIQAVATEGPGLVFIVYPAAIATMPGSTFWALIFFMMLLTLGLDSSVRIFLFFFFPTKTKEQFLHIPRTVWRL